MIVILYILNLSRITFIGFYRIHAMKGQTGRNEDAASDSDKQQMANLFRW